MRCLGSPLSAFVPFNPSPILKVSHHGSSSRHIDRGAGSQFKLWDDWLLPWDRMNRVCVLIPQIDKSLGIYLRNGAELVDVV